MTPALVGELPVRQSFKRCSCHPAAERHRFGNSKMLNCVRAGCSVNWFQHQLDPQPCEGSKIPGSRDDG